MITIDKRSKLSLYQQVYKEIRRQILTGEYAAGQQLPATRNVAIDYHISRNTVLNAYRQLQAEGFISSRRGSGYYVEDLPALSVQPASRIERMEKPVLVKPAYDFRYGCSDVNVYKTNAFRRCLHNAIGHLENETVLDYPEAKGQLGLRQELAKFLHVSRGVHAFPEQMFVTGGIHDSLHFLRALFPRKLCTFAIEEPGYMYSASFFKQAGFTIRPIPIDENGICIDALRDVDHAILYVTPSHQFPMGSILPAGRRLELLHWAASHDSYIIEDDYDSELSYQGLAIPSLQSLDTTGRVIYLGTFSKSLAPDLRVSYVIVPFALEPPAIEPYPFYSTSVPTLLQLALTEYIASGEYAKQLNRLRTYFRKKRDYILAYFKNHVSRAITIYGADGGMHLILQLPTTLPQAKLVQTFHDAAIGVYPLRPFFQDAKKCPHNQVLLGYGGISLNDLPRYMEALTKTIDSIE